ncbi:MAG: glycosyltransferase [Bacteroidales bacterium]|jgi:glycosyltransferase involved in cell wall biosynthesis|nr:glycosyltransferase [Bacteroidales bacterium]
MTDLHFSIIVPVFNRPDEVEELLESLSKQVDQDFEVVIVEDGSTITCDKVCQQYAQTLDLKYFFKPNSGRSETRNYGMERASGNYFVIYDSDCIIPPQYFKVMRKVLTENYVDCYGGPDNADDSFSPMQKAINYSMTSFFTTGGIRGGTKNKDKFSPRSFNMGISKEVFETVGGYKNMIGEDIDLSFRIKKAGFKTTLFKEAYVYHKRRVSLKKFFKQVNTFGKGRILLHHLHKGSLKLVHLLPMFFVLGNILLALLTLIFLVPLFLLPILLYIVVIFIDSLIKNKSFKIASLSILAAYTQLFGYGLGVLEEIFTGKAGKKKQEELYK